MARRASAAAIAALATTLITGGLVVAQDEAVMYTGCLDVEGNLTNVAAGGQPAAPCDKSQELAQWSIEGPAGPQGEQGEPGPQGEQGHPASRAPRANRANRVTKARRATPA